MLLIDKIREIQKIAVNDVEQQVARFAEEELEQISKDLLASVSRGAAAFHVTAFSEDISEKLGKPLLGNGSAAVAAYLQKIVHYYKSQGLSVWSTMCPLNDSSSYGSVTITWS